MKYISFHSASHLWEVSAFTNQSVKLKFQLFKTLVKFNSNTISTEPLCHLHLVGVCYHQQILRVEDSTIHNFSNVPLLKQALNNFPFHQPLNFDWCPTRPTKRSRLPPLLQPFHARSALGTGALCHADAATGSALARVHRRACATTPKGRKEPIGAASGPTAWAMPRLCIWRRNHRSVFGYERGIGDVTSPQASSPACGRVLRRQ